MRLIACDVTKIIKGNVILSHINLTMESGNIYCFSGPNGCGKTMLFRALSGLISISSGTILLDDKVLKKDFSVLPNLGILLENVSLYPDLTGCENLEYLAHFQKKINRTDIENALQRVGLDPHDKRNYAKYSLGMKQRLAIAQAFMEKPDIIMLDEPTNSLDQDAVAMVHKIILEEKERGALILLTSHYQNDIYSLTDYVYYMKNGTLYSERRA